MKMVKSDHFCIQSDTPTPRLRNACLSVQLRLGVGDECKTHLCFEFISHAILCI